MKEFTYLVADELGIHARPAGLLVKLAKTFPGTTVTVTKRETTNLGVKKGDEVKIAAEGPAEEEAIAALEAFFKENL